MAFFKRVMDHLLNQVLVETLANSKWFQRFAVHSHKLSKEVAEKGGLVRRCPHSADLWWLHGINRMCVCPSCCAGKDHSKVLDEHVSSFMDKAKQVSAQVG